MWTRREKMIMNEMVRKSEGRSAFAISAHQIALAEVVDLIYFGRARPKTPNETAAWTMRHMIPKLDRLGCDIKRASSRGRGSLAIYSYTDKTIEILKGLKARGELSE